MGQIQQDGGTGSQPKTPDRPVTRPFSEAQVIEIENRRIALLDAATREQDRIAQARGRGDYRNEVPRWVDLYERLCEDLRVLIDYYRASLPRPAIQSPATQQAPPKRRTGSQPKKRP